MKKIIILTSFIAITFLFSGCSEKEDSTQSTDQKITKPIASVQVQSVATSKSLSQELSYPGTVAYDQEITVTAKSSGTIKSMSFDLASQVRAGQTLVVIDDTGNNLQSQSEGNLKSAQIQQLENDLAQAKKRWSLTKRNYEDDDSDANRTAKKLAEIDYENAQIALKSALDSHLVTAPITGKVTKRSVSQGDSVTVGAPIATISQTDKVKIKFFVAAEEVPNFKNGMAIKIIGSDDKEFSATINNISASADQTSKRFLIEAVPTEKQALLSGTIVTVVAAINSSVSSHNSIIIPLSAVIVDQNDNYIFVDENGKAKKVSVEIEEIKGETAQISTSLPLEAQIIIKGNKTLKDGDPIERS